MGTALERDGRETCVPGTLWELPAPHPSLGHSNKLTPAVGVRGDLTGGQQPAATGPFSLGKGGCQGAGQWGACCLGNHMQTQAVRMHPG